MINNNTYKKVVREEIRYDSPFNWHNWGSSNTYSNTSTDSIFFRNDSINKKAYVRYKNDSLEHLHSDFSIQLGDTVNLGNIGAQYHLLIVDSVFYQMYNGVNRKTFSFVNFNGFSSSIKLIEGVGYTSHFLDLFTPFSSPASPGNFPSINQLVQLCQNGNSLYSNPSSIGNNFPYPSSTCNLPTNLNEQAVANIQLRVYPNPTKDFATINYAGFQGQAELRLFTELGQNIEISLVSAEQESIRVDVSGLKKGIYFVTLQDEQGKSKHVKLLKL